ncbi:MAG TPA: MFS transporter [Candidatus Limnocylindrales bacterium]|nr:MFS transporter [Candidatus Limnocylindrales bacterium]
MSKPPTPSGHATPSRRSAVVAFICVFSAVGASAPFLPVYYQSLGLSLDAIGLLAAVAALTALFAAPAWGVVSDRLRSRYVLLVACLGAAISSVLLGLAVEPVVVALCAILYWLWFAGVPPLLDAQALEAVGEDHFQYSRLRVWGSAAFIVSTLVVGALIERAGLRSLFVVFVGALMLTGLVALRLSTTHARPSMPRLSGLRAVLGNRTAVTFIGIALLTWSASTAVNGFLSIYMIEIGTPGTVIGFAWALGAGVEIPLMIAFPQLARRFGLETLVVAGAAFLLLRVLALLLVHDPLLVAATMTLHGAGFALLLVGGVTYVARHAPSGAEATAQGLLSGVTIGLSQAVGPLFGGALAGVVGLPTMFVFPAVGSAVALAAMVWAVLRPAVSERRAAGSAR